MPGNYSKLVTVITGQTITAAERNNEFDNVINNMTPDGVDDASANLAAMQATADPAGGSLATSLRGELQRIRFQLLKLGAASGNWYDAPPFLAGVTPATPGATATDLSNRLAQLAFQIKALSGATNWYDAMAWLAAITPATPGATATDMNNRLAQIVSQIKALGGLTNWYDTVTAALLKAGGTMAGAIAMGTNKITGLGNGTAVQDAAAFGQVKVIQIVQSAATTTATSTTSSTFAAATNHTVQITPTSASNRVYLLFQGPYGMIGTTTFQMTIKRGSTELSGVASGFYQATCALPGGQNLTYTASYIDSPASTSLLTYQVFIRSTDNTNAVTVGRTDLPYVLVAAEIV